MQVACSRVGSCVGPSCFPGRLMLRDAQLLGTAAGCDRAGSHLGAGVLVQGAVSGVGAAQSSQAGVARGAGQLQAQLVSRRRPDYSLRQSVGRMSSSPSCSRACSAADYCF